MSLAIDLGLLGVFAVQHSGMARPAFNALVDPHRARRRPNAPPTCWSPTS
jgi:hypothetical protein